MTIREAIDTDPSILAVEDNLYTNVLQEYLDEQAAGVEAAYSVVPSPRLKLARVPLPRAAAIAFMAAAVPAGAAAAASQLETPQAPVLVRDLHAAALGMPGLVDAVDNCDPAVDDIHYYENDPGRKHNTFGPAVEIEPGDTGDTVLQKMLDEDCVDMLHLTAHEEFVRTGEVTVENDDHRFLLAEMLEADEDARDEFHANYVKLFDNSTAELVTFGGSYRTQIAKGENTDWHLDDISNSMREEVVLKVTLESGEVRFFKLSCNFQPMVFKTEIGGQKFISRIIRHKRFSPPPKRVKGPGTPLSGPEQQPVQENGNLAEPTSGYTRGNAEIVITQQQTETVGSYDSTTYGTDTGTTSGSPAGTQGGTDAGTSAGDNMGGQFSGEGVNNTAVSE